RVCVGPGEYPRALEWELRSGLTLLADWAKHYSHQTKRARETGLALIATPVSFVRKFGERESEEPPPSQPVGLPIHNLGTRKQFGNIRPRLKSTKNWSSDSRRSNRLHFEWKASGLTVVSFWTAPKPSGLEGQARSNFGWTLPGAI